jgi:hypothetical protein
MPLPNAAASVEFSAGIGQPTPPLALPQFKLDHVNRMTDDTGMMQHAIFTLPNRAEGYATDDNARALILTVLIERCREDQCGEQCGGFEPGTLAAPPDWPYRYLALLEHAFNPENGRFRNFLGYDRRWMERQGSEDSHGRALWALGTMSGRSAEPGLKSACLRLFEASLPVALDFYSPRACAYTLLGMEEYLRVHKEDDEALRARFTLSRRLQEMYETIRTSQWKWFENVVAYGNARLPQAMMLVGAACGSERMVAVGLESLEWLMALQSDAATGHFVPIGSHGFYRRGGERARFDQQPLEAAGAVSACLQACRVTGEERWYLHAQSAFNWFLGKNDLQLPLYDSGTGGCRDGLHPDRVNQNQGAESTLSYLMAALEMHSFRKTDSLTERENIAERQDDLP